MALPDWEELAAALEAARGRAKLDRDIVLADYTTSDAEENEGRQELEQLWDRVDGALDAVRQRIPTSIDRNDLAEARAAFVKLGYAINAVTSDADRDALAGLHHDIDTWLLGAIGKEWPDA